MSTHRTRFELRLSPEERTLLERRARDAGVSISAYVRACINAGEGSVVVIDVTPLTDALYELSRQGANLNQLVHLLNARGPGALELEDAETTLDMERDAFDDLRGTLASLRREARRHQATITDAKHPKSPRAAPGESPSRVASGRARVETPAKGATPPQACPSAT